MEVIGVNGWESGEFDAEVSYQDHALERVTMRWVDFGMVGQLRIRMLEDEKVSDLKIKSILVRGARARVCACASVRACAGARLTLAAVAQMVDTVVKDVYLFDFFNPTDVNKYAAVREGNYAVARPFPLVLYPSMLQLVKSEWR